VSLQSAHIPAHTHAFSVSSDAADATTPDGNLLGRAGDDNMYVAPEKIGSVVARATADSTTTVVGASTAHDNTMPTLSVSYCICARGLFPSRS